MKPINALLFGLGALATGPALAQGGGIARVQVIHNCADQAAAVVDVWLDNTLLLDDFGFRTATPFVDAPAGIPIQIGIAPSTSDDAGDAIYTQSVTLTSGSTYVIVAEGIVSSSGYTPAPAFTLSVYDQGREVAAGGSMMTDLLIHHGCTDAPAVDVFETAVLGATVVNDLSYQAFTDYLEVPTIDLTVQVRTADNSTVVAAYDAPLSTLGLGGAAITVLASGFLDPGANSGGAPFGLFVALASGGPLVPLPAAAIPTARVQVIHNSADLAAATVDVWLNNTLLLDDFAFRTASPFVDLQAGVDLTVGVAPASSDDPSDAIAQFTYNLAEGETYVLVANGIVSGSGYTPNVPFNILVQAGAREAATSGASNTDLLVFHGCTDAPTVDVAETAVLGGATLVDNLSYGSFAGYLEVPTADYALQVQDENGNELVNYLAPLASLGLSGAALTVVASGFLDPSANSSGPGFGLWAALATGGALVELPLATSVQEQQNDLLSAAWPNPANDVLHLELAAHGDAIARVEVLDASGRVLTDRNAPELGAGDTRLVLPVNHLAAGRYLVRLSTATGERTVQPFHVSR